MAPRVSPRVDARGDAQRREEFWFRKTRVSSFNRVGIAPRVVLARTRGAMPTRLNSSETLHGAGRCPTRLNSHGVGLNPGGINYVLRLILGHHFVGDVQVGADVLDVVVFVDGF
ncbi:hypothetical protein LF1_44730 [Rubripirellula obstinata]|uniref:Uncharacterized protein n=1 Tax=Rubripirellula obstinata TaxID=406547 RepID=A0A5B1CNH2_9BACT|nr:hypothetical protein LF1_44730 [Rubripirellula obstinata]